MNFGDSFHTIVLSTLYIPETFFLLGTEGRILKEKIWAKKKEESHGLRNLKAVMGFTH